VNVFEWSSPSAQITCPPSGPVADFAMSPNPAEVNGTIMFDASKSQGAYQYTWDWESDGSYDTSLQTNPKIEKAFSQAGTYNVTLQVVAADGKTATKKLPVTVVAAGSQLRTVIYLKKQTVSGQDIFIRGGIDHAYASSNLGLSCTSSNYLCAISQKHNISPNDPNRANDKYLDWYGSEPGQSASIMGSPLAWTTNLWPSTWGAKKTVAVDGYGEDPENQWGEHYWKLDVTNTTGVSEWFEFKAVMVQNGAVTWEPDMNQPNRPWVSSNHFAKKGCVNVTEWGSSTTQHICLPVPCYVLSPATVKGGDTVQVNASCSKNATAYRYVFSGQENIDSGWLNGQGNSTYQRTLNVLGSYSFTLQVRNDQGKIVSSQAYPFEVTPKSASCDFVADKLSVDMGGSVGFTAAASPGVTAYSWDFGDGVTFGSGLSTSANHVYDKLGQFAVTLSCNTLLGQTLTAVRAVTVNDNPIDAGLSGPASLGGGGMSEPGSPLGLPTPPDVSDEPTTAVGKIDGEFSVSMGSATYSIPIKVPPGRGGVEPKLALTYGAESDGSVGRLWGISGLSKIERCGRNWAMDNELRDVELSRNDYFCLDGQRLVAINGTYGLNNTEYRTLNDNFSKIVSYDAAGYSPGYFKVWTKDGRILTFGQSEKAEEPNNARDLANGRAAPAAGQNVVAWGMNREQSRAGNYYAVTYLNIDTSTEKAMLPAEVRYTSHVSGHVGSRSVKFVYEDNFWSSSRSPVRLYSNGGRWEELHHRLYAIETRVAERLVSRTRLRLHGGLDLSDPVRSSFLVGVDFCVYRGGEDVTSGEVCLKQTTINWNADNVIDEGFDSPAVSLGSAAFWQTSLPIDINGDARTDLVYIKNDRWHYRLANGDAASGFLNAEIDTGLIATGAYAGNNVGGCVIGATSCSSSQLLTSFYARPIDFNADGMMDILVPGQSGTPKKWDVLLATGASFSRQTTNLDMLGENNNVQIMDINGDGLSDLVAAFCKDAGDCPASNSLRWHIALNQKGSFSAYVKTSVITTTPQADVGRTRSLDYNGDGRMDLLVSDNAQYAVLRSTGNSFEKLTVASLNDTTVSGSVPIAYDTNNSPLVLDINGDGLPDILGVGVDGGVRKYRLWTNTGGKYASRWLQWQLSSPESLGINHHVVMDYNQDGREDILAPAGSGGGWLVQTSLGGDFIKASWTYANMSSAGIGKNPSIVDMNGDGYADFLNVDASTQWVVHQNTNRSWVAPYQVERINEGGDSDLPDSKAWRSIKIQSKPIVRAEVYTPGAACSYPTICVKGAPMWVVSSVKITNGTSSVPTASDIESSYTETQYRYGDLKFHARGHGSLGFGWIESENLASGDGTKRIVERTTFDQATKVTLKTFANNTWSDGQFYGLVGMPIKEEKWLGAVGAAGSQKLAESVTEYAPHLFGVNTVWARYFVHPLKVTDREYAFNVGYAQTGAKLSERVSTMGVDDYGNMTSLTEDEGGGRIKTTVNTIKPLDTTNWIIANVDRNEVTFAALGKTSQKRVTKYDYTASGLLWKTTVEPDAANVAYQTITENHYDSWGNVDWVNLSGNNVAGRKTITTYDVDGYYPRTVTNPANLGEIRTYDARFGTMTAITDANGLTTKYTYDAFGRKILEVRPDKTWIRYYYFGDTSGIAAIKLQTENSDGQFSESYIDTLGRVVQNRDLASAATQKWSVTRTEYDALGRVARSSKPYFAYSSGSDSIFWTTTEYDALSRPIKVTQPDGGATRIEMNDYQSHEVDANGQKTTRTINAQGLTTAITDAMGNIMEYSYNVFGDTEGVSIKRGATTLVTTIGYDLYGRKISLNDPDMGYWTYSYNVFGELVSQRDAKQQVTTMTYDGIGRMVSRAGVEGSTSWIYDTAVYGKGKLDYVAAPGYVERSKYDKLARAIETSYTVDSRDYVTKVRYDGLGRTRLLSYPTNGQVSGVAVHYYYDDVGRLDEVKDHFTGASYWKKLSDDAEGHITSERYGNGVTTLREFDAQSGLLKAINAGSNNSVQNEAYRYDSDGNLLARTNQWLKTNTTQYLGYDGLNRLTCAVSNNNTAINDASRSYCASSALSKVAYKYDGLGNLINKPDVGAADYGYGDPNNPAKQPHAVYTAGGQNYQYDANGNMISGAGRGFVWTSYNKPKQITKSGVTVDLAYDANYNRMMKTVAQNGSVRKTVYIAGIYELTTEGNSQKHRFYVNGSDTVAIVLKEPTKPTQTLYLHKDHLGSVSAVTDQTAKVVERLAFDAWGKRLSPEWKDNQYTPSVALARGYTGHELDEEVGLVNMKGRLYDPILGRFISPDPLVQAPSHTQSLNRYTYVMNNPLSMVDPSGFSWLSKQWKKAKRAVKGIGRALSKVWHGVKDFAVARFHDAMRPVAGLLGGTIESLSYAFKGEWNKMDNGFEDGFKYGWHNPRRTLRKVAKFTWDVVTFNWDIADSPYKNAKSYDSQEALIDAYRDEDYYVVLRGYSPLGPGQEWAAEHGGGFFGDNNAGFFHEEVVIITPDGNIIHFGFQQGEGVVNDAYFDNRIYGADNGVAAGYYRFDDPMKIPASVGDAFFEEVKRGMLSNYRAKDYNLGLHNCQDFADEYRKNIRVASAKLSGASTLATVGR
jgi:RHS repeat-associated protein